jgi:hypothetical protein
MATIISQPGTFSLDGVASAGTADRDTDIYPKTSQGNQAYKAMIESSARSVAIVVTSGPRAGQTLAALSDPVAVVPGSTNLTEAAGSPVSYQGIIDTANTLNSHPNMMTFQVVGVNGSGGIEIANVGPDRNPNNGRVLRYLVDDKPTDGFSGRFFDPHFPLTIQLLWVDPNVPVYQWVSNSSMNHADYTKAITILTFK